MGNILEMLEDESKSAHYNKIAEKNAAELKDIEELLFEILKQIYSDEENDENFATYDLVEFIPGPSEKSTLKILRVQLDLLI
nr:9342_t:CDS:2 [Entrophospora candida]